MPDINHVLLQFIEVMNFGRPVAAFLPICVINDTGDKRLCVSIRVKVSKAVCLYERMNE